MAKGLPDHGWPFGSVPLHRGDLKFHLAADLDSPYEIGGTLGVDHFRRISFESAHLLFFLAAAFRSRTPFQLRPTRRRTTVPLYRLAKRRQSSSVLK